MSGAPTLRVPVGANDHAEGVASARVVLVEYGDYECPHCGAAYPIVKQLQQTMGHDLRLVFRNFPIAESHPHAMAAACAAEAAGLQGQFWPMHDLLFEHQRHLDSRSLVTYAERLGLDLTRFEHDVTTPDVASRVEADLYGGARSGVNGTPTFFIQGTRFDGDYSYASLLHALKSAAKA